MFPPFVRFSDHRKTAFELLVGRTALLAESDFPEYFRMIFRTERPYSYLGTMLHHGFECLSEFPHQHTSLLGWVYHRGRYQSVGLRRALELPLPALFSRLSTILERFSSCAYLPVSDRLPPLLPRSRRLFPVQ